jgi:broad specificity phosphatase PhoE
MAPRPRQEKQMSSFRMLLLCLLFMAVPAAVVMSQPAPPPGDLLYGLRLGGYVIVLRHGATSSDVAKDGMSNPAKAAGERQLSDAGRAQAKVIGEGLRALGIPVGLVVTSPLQRAIDTGTLLGVGEVKTNPDLAEAGASVTPAERDRRAADTLRKLVGSHSGHTNVVIVTHRPNLVEAFGESFGDIREGEAAVFEPDVTGAGYRLMARIPAGDWPAIRHAALDAPEEPADAPTCLRVKAPAYD